MAKPPPYPPKSSGAKMMGPSKKKLKHPSFAGSDTEPYNVRPQKPKPKRVGDLRNMTPRKPPAKTMPKQMGPKKTMKPKQMKMKRMGY